MAAGTRPLYCWYVDIDETNDLLFLKFQLLGLRPVGVRLSHGRYWARGCTNQQDDLFGNLQAEIRKIEDQAGINQQTRTVCRWKGENYSSATGTRGEVGRMEIVAQSWVTIDGQHPQNTFDVHEFGWSKVDEPTLDSVAANAIPWDGTGVPGFADRRTAFVSIGPYNVKSSWVPEKEFVFDSENYPVGRSSGAVCMDGTSTRTVSWGTRTMRETRHDILPAASVFQAEESRLYQSVQRFHAWYSMGKEFEFHPDMNGLTQLSSGDLWGRYVMDNESRDPWPASTPVQTARLYEISFTMLRTKELQAPITGPGTWSQDVETVLECASP